MKNVNKNIQPSVAIIIVNYNGFNDTVECLQSLNKIEYSNYNIYVVDNASSIKPTEEQKKYISQNSIYIKSEKNLGFSGGNNIGIKKALEHGYDYILLLNNDTTVEPNFLKILVETAKKKCNVGIVGGKILFYRNPNRLWFGGGYLNEKYGYGAHERWNELNTQDSGKVREVTFITGCLMLIPSNVFRNIGLLSEEYFLYSEDTDFCYKVLKAGYRLFFCENTMIYHKVSASTGSTSNRTQYYMVRNILYLAKKYRTDYFKVNLRFTYKTIKDIIRRRKRLMPVFYAYIDYLRGNMGKWDK